MRTLITAGLALSAVCTAVGQAHAATNYPWCIISNNRGMDCIFSSRAQCDADGRNRGFGSNCRQNPDYKPGLGPVIQNNRRPRPGALGGTQRPYYPKAGTGTSAGRAVKFTSRILNGGSKGVARLSRGGGLVGVNLARQNWKRGPSCLDEFLNCLAFGFRLHLGEVGGSY